VTSGDPASDLRNGRIFQPIKGQALSGSSNGHVGVEMQVGSFHCEDVVNQ